MYNEQKAQKRTDHAIQNLENQIPPTRRSTYPSVFHNDCLATEFSGSIGDGLGHIREILWRLAKDQFRRRFYPGDIDTAIQCLGGR
jgi:hypothetical protein